MEKAVPLPGLGPEIYVEAARARGSGHWRRRIPTGPAPERLSHFISASRNRAAPSTRSRLNRPGERFRHCGGTIQSRPSPCSRIFARSIPAAVVGDAASGRRALAHAASTISPSGISSCAFCAPRGRLAWRGSRRGEQMPERVRPARRGYPGRARSSFPRPVERRTCLPRGLASDVAAPRRRKAESNTLPHRHIGPVISFLQVGREREIMESADLVDFRIPIGPTPRTHVVQAGELGSPASRFKVHQRVDAAGRVTR